LQKPTITTTTIVTPLQNMAVKMCHLLASLVFLGLGSLIASEGQNCHGNGCSNFSNPQDMPSLDKSLNQSSDTLVFRNGENIACIPGVSDNLINGGICVWFWNTQNTSTGADAKQLYPYIRKNCGLCGSLPTNIWGNDVSDGELTIGWSPNTACDGPCNEQGGSDYLPGVVVPGAGLGTSGLRSRIKKD